MTFFKTFCWGLYLTCSWTWCIGMLLPILLLHRYGWEGFAMFAISNVIGCTLFGYIVRTPERSRALVEKYARAMSWFAIVTIAFHAFFIVMMMLMHCENANPLLTRFLPFGIVIVGGEGAAELSSNADAIRLVQEAASAGKMIGAWGEAVGVLASAGVVRGVKLTAPASCSEELRKAGEKVGTRQLMTSVNFVTGFDKTIVMRFGKALAQVVSV